jgi:hypothetical protein
MAVERARNVGMGDGCKINAGCAVECAVSPPLRRPISGFGLKARPKNILDDVLIVSAIVRHVAQRTGEFTMVRASVRQRTEI